MHGQISQKPPVPAVNQIAGIPIRFRPFTINKKIMSVMHHFCWPILEMYHSAMAYLLLVRLSLHILLILSFLEETNEKKDREFGIHMGLFSYTYIHINTH